jgi:SAM-dependent methyltransferase
LTPADAGRAAGANHSEFDGRPGEDPVVPDFDAVYRADPDPWRVRSSHYETRKLAIVLACLTRESYRKAWDPGCGVGELAARLASRADWILATDGSAEAVSLARTRCAGLSNVVLTQLRLPGIAPVGDADLIVLSEFWYYLPADARKESLDMIRCVSSHDAELLSVHWRHRPHDAWLSGEDVQAEIATRLEAAGWSRLVHHDDEAFVLDVHRNGA